MKHLPIAIITFILGFIVTIIFSSIFDGNSTEYSYLSAITCSVLFLSAVVVLSTGLILDKLDLLINKKKNQA